MAADIPTYPELAARWKALRGSHDAIVRDIACVNAPRTLLCVEFGEGPVVHLSAAVHGDEPAGALALLALAETRALDPRFAYRLWPVLNPTGFEAGTRDSVDGIDVNRTFSRGGGSPEAGAVIMANRDRKFALAIDLHEDDEAAGFYCYSYGAGDAARDAFVAGAAHAGADARGVLEPDPIAEAEALGGLSLSLLLRRGAARSVLTIETPSQLFLERRVSAHVAAVRAALARC